MKACCITFRGKENKGKARKMEAGIWHCRYPTKDIHMES
uniref:Uncharacterized protein n=1 Tax=Arundo donax TaxID=35708 RepID=A0A0A9B821_ARUDO